MREPILVINAGSSSIKFSVFETAADRSLSAGAHGQVEGIGTSPHLEVSDPHGNQLVDTPVAGTGHSGAIAVIHDWFAAHVGSEAGFDGVGHRVVHGGSTYSQPVAIDNKVITELEALVPLAPLHQPHHIAAIRAIRDIAPNVPQIACFDTAFHRSQPALAQQFAIPRELTAKGVRRYGFHGLSYEYIVSALPEIAPDCAKGKLVVAHLGNGASMCAIDRGQSVATTMSFTALDGLPMGTRTGALDPGVILYLLQQEGMDAKAIEQLIYQRSGLLGVSGISSDMRALLASAAPPQNRLSTSLSIASDASSDLLPWHWAGSTRWYSRRALASTRPRSGRAPARRHIGSALHWTRRPMPRAARAFRGPAPRGRLG